MSSNSSIPSTRSTRIPSSLLIVLVLSSLPIQALAKGGGGGGGRGGGGGSRGGGSSGTGGIIIVGTGGHYGGSSSGGGGGSDGESLSTGAIIGIVFGVIGGLGLIIGLLYICQKRRERNLHDDDDDDDHNKDVLPMYQPAPAYPVLGMGLPDATTTHTPYPDISAATMPPPNYDAPSIVPSASSPMPSVYPVMPTPVLASEAPSYPVIPSPVPSAVFPAPAYPVIPSAGSTPLYPPPSSPPPSSSPPMYPLMPVAPYP
ncbi:hypothetical protein BGZ59_000122 [Podila verticillata]|nr:hypothetical protein BGZ59_000122 [Podila verticillata]